ncbi:MAG: helix-turn-helix transcriptional regulator [Oscillospiraceae bacterium]|nr:helix-turn-helix transcriptional regulator [Oscillospiraceae bacterium]
MNKERLGNFIGDERKALGLTQKDLAARLHVTDKAVSKWERGLSYPDVTLLEPLAAVLDLGVEELMACRRQAVREEKEDETVKNLLALSGDNLRAERSRSRKKLAVLAVLAALLLAAAAGAVWFYLETFASEQGLYSIEWKETIDGVNYIYVEREGQLLRLKCGEETGFDGITLRNEYGEPWNFQLHYRWNRRTCQGVVISCEATSMTSMSMAGLAGSMIGLDTMPGTDDELFGYPCVFCEYANVYQNRYGKGEEVYSCRFWSCDPETWEKEKRLLTVDDCFAFAQTDYDQDGVTELAVRTRWEMKPYILYDLVDGEVVETWPDTVEPELAERLLTAVERQEQWERELARQSAEADG